MARRSPVIVIVLLCTVTLVAAQEKRSAVEPMVVQEIDVAGLKRVIQLADGNTQPLLVNFWATWCEPCRGEFPDLVGIDEEYSPQGLRFVTVSLDAVSHIGGSVPEFLQQMRARMPAYLLNADEPDAAINVIDPTWSGALPATFLYDTQGHIVFKRTGRIKPAELRAAIEKVIPAGKFEKTAQTPK